MICGMRREGIEPADFQLWIVDGLIPVTAASRRVPPSRFKIFVTANIAISCA